MSSDWWCNQRPNDVTECNVNNLKLNPECAIHVFILYTSLNIVPVNLYSSLLPHIMMSGGTLFALTSVATTVRVVSFRDHVFFFLVLKNQTQGQTSI